MKADDKDLADCLSMQSSHGLQDNLGKVELCTYKGKEESRPGVGPREAGSCKC